MKVRRKTALLKKAASESLSLAVELFNRPVATARDPAVLVLLGHSFEMLLKAVIYQRRGRIRDPGEPYTYRFVRVINIARSDLGALQEGEMPVVLALKQDRDTAAHDTVEMSDDLLWLHVRSAVTIFSRIVKAEFDEELTELIPARVVPVSALPPTDAASVIEREMEEIARLLAPKTRKGAEARSRLRPLLALDGSATGREDRPSETEVERAVKAIRASRDWQSVFPGLAQITISPAPKGGSQEITLRVSKTGRGAAVRPASPDEADSALLYRSMDPFQEFNIKLSEFGEKLGLTRHQGHALVWKLKLKEDPRSYFEKRRPNGSIVYQGLGPRALHLAREEMTKPVFDLASVVKAYNTRSGTA
jgi:hypothetical protein